MAVKHDPHLANDLIIRSLEAKVARLMARCAEQDAAISALARSFEAAMSAPAHWRGAGAVSIDECSTMAGIASAIALTHGVEIGDLTGPKRAAFISRARQAAFAAMLDAGYSSNQVGRFFARDHSTVLEGAARHKERLGK